jgi:hypothetical protein
VTSLKFKPHALPKIPSFKDNFQKVENVLGAGYVAQVVEHVPSVRPGSDSRTIPSPTPTKTLTETSRDEDAKYLEFSHTLLFEKQFGSFL